MTKTTTYVLLALLLSTFTACSQQSDQQSQSNEISKTDKEQIADSKLNGPQSSFKPFYVFSDKGNRGNHFTPSGFMPNGECLNFEDGWIEKCHEGKNCIRIDYDLTCSRDSQKWAGIYWLNPPNNWGNRKGGYDLSGASQLTFWAKGDSGGEQINEIIVGGITGNYPDSDTAVIGPIILTPQWRKYSIDLRGKDLSYISGGFAWSTSENVNLEECTFYLDEIRFE